MKKTLILSATAAALFCASTAVAQQRAATQAATQPAAPAAQAQAPRPSNPGPVIPGVCYVNDRAALGRSEAVASMNRRLLALAPTFDATNQSFENDRQAAIRTAQGQTQAQQQQAEAAFRTKWASHIQMGQRVSATQERQLQRVAASYTTAFNNVYVTRRCGIVFNVAALVEANPAMDITAAVTAELNRVLPTLGDFALEPAPAAQPAAARP